MSALLPLPLTFEGERVGVRGSYAKNETALLCTPLNESQQMIEHKVNVVKYIIVRNAKNAIT